MSRRQAWTSDPGDTRDVVVGVWRLSPAAWEALRALVPDAETLGTSHQEWTETQRRRQVKSEAKGYEVVVRDLDPESLHAWCRENGRPLDAGGRAKYGLSLLTERVPRKTKAAPKKPRSRRPPSR